MMKYNKSYFMNKKSIYKSQVNTFLVYEKEKMANNINK